jgi:hypothetical protein
MGTPRAKTARKLRADEARLCAYHLAKADEYLGLIGAEDWRRRAGLAERVLPKLRFHLDMIRHSLRVCAHG